MALNCSVFRVPSLPGTSSENTLNSVSDVSVQILYPLKTCEAPPGYLHRPTPSRQFSRQNSAVVDELEMCKSLVLRRHQWSMVL